jgi:tetratricopeptide (TPR) repeat protein
MQDEAPPRLAPFALSRFVHREVVVLVILTGVAVVAFLVTKASADAEHRLRLRDAAIWYARGVDHLSAGRIDLALTALGRARALDRHTAAHHLSFASALIASDQQVAARQVLLGLREAHPADPQVNLGLAELAATRGSTEEAVTYYQRALYGDWDPARLDDRERVRVNLIEYLLRHDMRDRASAQLLLLAADLPDDQARHIEAGRLMLDGGEPARALALFTRVLEREPAHPAALEGAGDAAFALGDYAAARGYYARAPASPGVTAALRTSSLVLAGDPLAPRLSAAERRRRLASGQVRAAALLAACEPRVRSHADASEQLRALSEEVATLGAALAARRALDVEAVADGVAIVAGAIEFASTRCAPLEPESRAWLLIHLRERERTR